MNCDIITDTLLWYKIWQLSGDNPTRAKQKHFREPRRAYRTSWSRQGNQKSFTLTIPWNLASHVKHYPSVIHCTSTPHRSETNGIAERAVRRVKEGTSAVLLQSGLDNEWWADSMECYCYLRNTPGLLSDGKTPCERRFGTPFTGPVIPSGAMVEYHLFLRKTFRDYINLVLKSCQETSSVMSCMREESGKETLWSQTLKNFSRWTRLNSTPEGSMQRKC